MHRFCCFAALLFVVASTVASAGDRYERFLDPSLKLLYRAQTGDTRMSQGEAREVLARLHSPERAGRGASTDMLNLVVKFPGDEKRLAEVGFKVDTCIGAICTGTLPIERLPELARFSGIHRIEASRQMWASVHSAAMEGATGAPSAGTGTRNPKNAGGTGVLIGYIDTGVDIFHSDFIDGSGNTRIKYLLDFSDPGDTNGDGVLDGAGPYGGTLYTEADINAAISAGTFAATDTTGHGTHGLSVAAGDDATYPGMAAETDLIVVKASREDGSLGFYSTDIINALAFVDEQAELLGQPYVVNLSLGSMFCSHDGRSLEEQAIDALVGPGIPGKVAVIAAGNSSANRSTEYKHFSGTAYVGLDQTHTLTVPAYTPNAGSGNDRILLDLWYEGRDELTITVEGPASCGSPQVVTEFGTFSDTPTGCGDVFIANMGGANPLNGDIESIILIDDWSGTEPAEGDWTITITGEAIGDDGVYHGWLADESVVGSTSPYLSANANNAYLVGKPGGAYNGITVGSYALNDPGTRFLTEWDDVDAVHRVDSSAIDGDISNFSSPGPTRDGRVKPELTAPGERVMGAVSRNAFPGSPYSVFNYHPWYPAEPDALLVDNTPDSTFGMLQGTSFAAPVVTGLVARILNENPAMDAIQVRNILINSAGSDAFTGNVPANEWGYGKGNMTVGTASPLPDDLRITVDEFPDGFVNEQYNLVLTASGGTLPYTWFVTAGILPPGLMLEGGGFLTGKPTTAGAFPFTIQVTDTSAPVQVRSKDLEIVVGTSRPLHFVGRSQPVARIDEYYESAVAARGGTLPHIFSLAGGSLPPGLTLYGDGKISGTPTLLGTFPFTVQVEDSVLTTASSSVKIKVKTPGGDDWALLGKLNPTVNRIAVDPTNSDHVMCSTRNIDAVFESWNAGDSWSVTSINKNLNSYAHNIRISPLDGTVLAVKKDRPIPDMPDYEWDHIFKYDASVGLWNSMWSDSNTGIGDVDFDSGGTPYFFTTNPTTGPLQEFFWSTNQGLTWTMKSHTCAQTIYNSNINSLSVFRANPDFIYVLSYDDTVGDDKRYMCMSDDGGNTWNDVLSGSSGTLDVHVSQVDSLNVVKAGDGFLDISLDGGRNWTVLSAPGGARCLARSFDSPDLLLLGTGSGLFVSSDSGGTWEAAPLENGTLSVTAVETDPTDADIMWAGTDQGLFRSADGGQSWEIKNAGLIHRTLAEIEVSSADPLSMMLLTTEGPFLSRASGDSWTHAKTGLVSADLRNCVLARLDPDLYYLIHSGRLYRSDNRGISWFETAPTFNPGNQYVTFDTDPFNSELSLGGMNGSKGTYRSTDRGETWVGVYADLPFSEPTDLTFALDTEGRVFVSFNSNGIYLSENKGNSWSEYGLNSQTVEFVKPAPSDSDHVYAYSSGSIYFHLSGGGWQVATTTPQEPILDLGIDANDPMTAYASCDHPGTGGNTGGIHKTMDGGQNWSLLSGVLDSFDVVSIATHPTESGVLWAATRFGGVYRSENSGATWELLSNYGTIADLTNVNLQDPSNEFLLFAGTEGYGVQASVDDGKTFAPRVEGLTNYYINALAFDPDDPTTLYAGSDEGVFKSTDSANTWAPTSLTAGEVSDMVTDNEGSARRIWVTVAGEGVAYSDDAGTTFTTYSIGLSSLELTSIEVEYLEGSARRIWVTGHGGDGVAFSEDLGQTWTSASGNGLTDRNLNDLAIDGLARRIWVTTDTSVFFTDNEGLSWNELALGLPSGIPVTSVSVDPNTGEALVSLYSEDGGGVYRGGNISGLWREFSNGLDELKVKKLTNDNGHTIDATTLGTTFYASTRGDGVYRAELKFEQTDPPVVTATSLPDALLRLPYAETLTATGGTPPYYWNLHTGVLPPGLKLDAETGDIFGTPGQVGRYAFTMQVSDANNQLAREDLVIEVVPPDELIVLECTPEVGVRGQTLDVTISGALFVDGATSDFGAGTTVTSTSWVSEYELTANLTIAIDATPGMRTVTVTNPDMSSASLGDGFKVDYPTPVVDGINPSAGSRTAALDVTITGQYFEDPATVDLGTDVTINSTTFISQGELSANISIAVDAPLGLHTVTVTNPNGFVGSLADSFEVLPAPPSVFGVSPDQGNQGATLSVSINGSDFQEGATSTFGAGITVNSTTFVSSGQLSANVSITGGTALGPRMVTVTNPDSQTGGLADIFTVMGPPPQILGLTPNQGTCGITLEVTITGNNFQQGAVSDFGTGITVNSTNHISSTLLTANLSIDPGASLGARDVTVTNADNQSATWASGFEVIAPPPQLSSIAPAEANRGSTLAVALTGSNFITGASASFGTGIAVNSTSFNSSSQLTANITIDPAATVGQRTVTVTNPDSQTTSLVDSFLVLAEAPQISSVAPATVSACAQVTLVVKGFHFQDGAVVDCGPDISIDSVTFASTTRLDVTVTIAKDAVVGTRSVTVTNPDSQSATWSSDLIVEPAGYISTIVPFVWIDPSGATPTGIVGDDVAQTIPIGFSFSLFGETYTDVTVSSNGYLTFGGTGTSFENQSLPDPTAPNALIAVFWDDLEAPADTISWRLLGIEPDRRLVVTWSDVRPVGFDDGGSFQVVLYEGSDQVLLQYLDTNFASIINDSGASATLGLEDGTGERGLEISFDSASVTNGSAWLVSMPACQVACQSPPQPSIAGPAVTCDGDDITLVADSGFDAYQWSTGETTQSIDVSPSETTSYTVTVLSSEGCTGTSASHTVTVNALPTVSITGPTSVCEGDSLTLDAGAGFSSYMWSTGATTQTIDVSPTEETGYTVTVTNAEGCSATSASHTVTVNPLPTVSITGPTSVCDGSSVTLDAGAGHSSYSWSTGATTQTIEVSPSSTTGYTVTVTDAEGCSATSDSHTVTVNALPIVSISGPTSVCDGSSVTLDAGPGHSSYSWSTGATTQTIEVSPSTTTGYTVTVTNAEGCSATSATHTVTVNALPTVSITGPISVCDGSSVTLDAGPGHSSYSWSTGATTQTIEVSPSATTGYTVTVANAEGCSATSASHNVTVSALPTATITGPTSVCEGSSVTLDAGAGFSSYMWSTGATTQTIDVSPSGITGYTVTVTNAEGCSDTSATHTVTVNPLPTVTITGPTSVCDGSSVTLDAGIGHTSYLWSTGATAQTIEVSPTESTDYTVTVTNPEGCAATSATHTVTVNALPDPPIMTGMALSGEDFDGTGVPADWSVLEGVWQVAGGELFAPYSIDNASVIAYELPAATTEFAITLRMTEDNAGFGEAHLLFNQAAASIDETVLGTVSAAVAFGSGAPAVTFHRGTGVATEVLGNLDVALDVDTNYILEIGEYGPDLRVTIFDDTGTALASTLLAGQGLGSPWIALRQVPDAGSLHVDRFDTVEWGVSPAICEGDSLLLDAGPGFVSYLWSTGETSQRISITPTEATAYTATVTNSAGCDGLSAELVVTVDPVPAPTISGPTTVCLGEQVTLDAGGGFSGYSWSTGATTQTIIVSPSETTDYTVTVTNAEGCSGISPTHTVTVEVCTPEVFVDDFETGDTSAWSATVQ